eukprot:TRINITY_DN6230_c0_g1_i1.p1 TRINITY_DN6230_c0_g1~~TRINITY_DN6230_c0_g1_i1.p1  ORF type:complete len:430 (-),score=138.13 TRINITY_DN6230_c0_g1_i1:627-1916(-)
MKAGKSSPLQDITEEELCQLFESSHSVPENSKPQESIPPKDQSSGTDLRAVDENSVPNEIEEEKEVSQLDKETLKKMQSNRFIFIGEKPGMEKVDKQKVEQVIEETLKSTEYYQRETEKLEAMKIRVTHMKEQLAQIKQNKKEFANKMKEVNQLVEGYRLQFDTTRTWVHIDMDMFFAAVEIKDKPHLANKPVAVGGYSMISTTNYVARKYGIRAAMPGFVAKKLCPELVFVELNYKKYTEVSEQVKTILYEYDPELESMGLDEANMDVTDYLTVNGGCSDENKIKLAKEIQEKIFNKVKLTASCGIAANNILAKISCGMHKPNGITLVPFDPVEIEKFMSTLSVRKIPGIGKVTEQLLNGLGFSTCKDIIDKAADLYVLFNEDNFEFYITQALGMSRNEHVSDDRGIQKNISISSTFHNISLYVSKTE